MIQSEKRKLERVKEEITELLQVNTSELDQTEIVDTIGFLLCETGFDIGSIYDEYMEGES